MFRQTILPWVVWAVVIFASIFIPVRCSQAQESFSIRSGDDFVRIKDEPCPGAPAWMGLRAAEMRYQGKDYKACWFALAQFVVILDDSGDKTPLPAAAFKKDLRT